MWQTEPTKVSTARPNPSASLRESRPRIARTRATARCCCQETKSKNKSAPINTANITFAPQRAKRTASVSSTTKKSSIRSSTAIEIPSTMRSSTTEVIAALLRIELRWAIRNGRAKAPSQNGSNNSIMNPMPVASLSCRNLTRSKPDNRFPHRSVRKTWIVKRIAK